jgi:hypothetical protein
MSTILHDNPSADSERQIVPPITLPTSHQCWFDVVSHQGMLDDLEDDDLNPGRAPQHLAMAGEGHPLELRAGADRVIRDSVGSWGLSLEQTPREGDRDGGWPFISFFTGDYGTGQGCALIVTSGEARVTAAQLLAAADKPDLP